MKVADLASSLAEHLGIGALEAGPGGEHSIYIDELQIDLWADADGVKWLRGEVAAVPDEDPQTFLKDLLTISFGRVRRQEATLSLDPEGRKLWLYLRLPDSHIPVDELAQKLEAFVNSLETWRQNAASGASSALPRGPMPFMMR